MYKELYTCDEFISMTRKDPLSWIGYCEILILDNGSIKLARPSHINAMINHAADIENMSVEEFRMKYASVVDMEYLSSKYSIIPVWYNYIIIPQNITDAQKITMKKLFCNNLIAELPSLKML